MDPIALVDKKILVTGGSGFLGAHLINKLHALKAEIYILDLNPIDKQPLLKNVSNDVIFYKVDLRNLNKTEKIIRDIHPEIIFHLSASIERKRSFENINNTIDINLKGTINLLRSLVNIDYKAFVFTSTSEVYGKSIPPFKEDSPLNPVSPYSASKASAEIFCKTLSEINGKPFTILRLFNIYGEGQDPTMFIPQLIHSCIMGRDFNMTKGAQTRELNYVGDVINALILASFIKKANKTVFNIGNGEEISLKKIAKIVLSLMDNKIKLNLGSIDYRNNEIWRMFCDNTKAIRILGWHPEVSLKDGLQKTINRALENRLLLQKDT